jgi:hypothetical protein
MNQRAFFDDLYAHTCSSFMDDFMHRLCEYLGPYLFLFQLTCKRFSKLPFPSLQRYQFLLQEAVELGQLNVLTYMEKNDMLRSGRVVDPNDVPTLDWCIKTGYLYGESALCASVNAKNVDMILECLRRRYRHRSIYAVAASKRWMLDLLWNNKVEPETNVFDTCPWFTREALEWFYEHKFEPAFNVTYSAVMISLDRKLEFLKIVDEMLTMPAMIQNYVKTVLCTENEPVPNSIPCGLFSTTVAEYVMSKWCKCNNPQNHELVRQRVLRKKSHN